MPFLRLFRAFLRERERERERHTQTDTQTHRQGQRYRARDREMEIETDKQTDRERETHTHKEREREREREREPLYLLCSTRITNLPLTWADIVPQEITKHSDPLFPEEKMAAGDKWGLPVVVRL